MAIDREPRSYEDLGRILRELRGRRSVRSLQTDRISKSTLHRYEAGAVIPVHQAKLLDTAYGGDGWVEVAVTRLGVATWRPWLDDRPKIHHVHRWPARYTGLVWMKLVPSATHVDEVHSVALQWGPWLQTLELPIGPEGLTLTTGKGPDDVAVDLNLDANPACHVLFGTEEINEGKTMDIRRGWALSH